LVTRKSYKKNKNLAGLMPLHQTQFDGDAAFEQASCSK
jgi:hypothetical protein